MGKPDTCDHIILRIIFRLGHLKKVKANGLTLPPTWQWLGSNARIEKDGSVILFEKDSYTPQELWNNSKERIDLVSGVN